MSANVAYWTGAWLNMWVIVALAAVGIRHARRGDYVRHRRCMLWAVGLVAGFLASYPFKLVLLGRETLGDWAPATVTVLRVHETCVAVMILGGVYALALALRRGLPNGDPASHERHRRAGWSAVAGATLGALTAAWVLWGMYARLP